MHLDIPATWDSASLRALAEQCSINGVTCSIYGAILDTFPTGRPDDVAVVLRQEIEQHFRLAATLGVESNYLLNGFKGVQLLDKPEHHIKEFIQWVARELNPGVITISDPKLARILSNKYGWNSFIISTIAGIKTVHELQQWMKQSSVVESIQSVVLHHDVVRSDREALLELVDFAQKHNIRLTVMVTESCYHSCRVRRAHYALVARPERMENGFDSHQASCILKRLRDPATSLDLSGFLMPEELGKIEAEIGISSFKITGRSCSNEWISNVAEYYLKGRSPVNLYDMIVFTAPLLKSYLNMKVSDLFFLDSSSYFSIVRNLKLPEPGSNGWRDFLNGKAVDLFNSGRLVIHDPDSEYIIRDGRIVQKKAGTYASMLADHLYQHRSLLKAHEYG
jgi:collagenase-like PrtC family protease